MGMVAPWAQHVAPSFQLKLASAFLPPYPRVQFHFPDCLWDEMLLLAWLTCLERGNEKGEVGREESKEETKTALLSLPKNCRYLFKAE